MDLSIKNILIKLLEKDYENWVIYSQPWIDAWNETNNCYIHIDPTNNGFVLMNNSHLEFAFVSSQYRRCGILKRMMNNIFEKYKNVNITLSSLDERTDKIWEKIGFICIKPRKGSNECSHYELYY